MGWDFVFAYWFVDFKGKKKTQRSNLDIYFTKVKSKGTKTEGDWQFREENPSSKKTGIHKMTYKLRSAQILGNGFRCTKLLISLVKYF